MFLLPSAYRSLSFCTAPHSSFLSARLECCPIYESLNKASNIFKFFTWLNFFFKQGQRKNFLYLPRNQPLSSPTSMRITYLRGFCSSATLKCTSFPWFHPRASSVLSLSAVLILSSDLNHLHIIDSHSPYFFLLFHLPAGHSHPKPQFSISKKECITFFLRQNYMPDFGKQHDYPCSNPIRNFETFLSSFFSLGTFSTFFCAYTEIIIITTTTTTVIITISLQIILFSIMLPKFLY